VKEILPKPQPEATVPQEVLLGREKPDETEVIPPETPGGRGLTAAEVKAREAAAESIDPERIEVIPPETLGGRGLTEAETDAARPR
jgi:hypothetical protein